MKHARSARTSMALLAVLAMVTALSLPALAAEGLTKVKGQVVDKDGKPLAKVPIMFEAVDIKKTVGPLRTNKEGEYFIAALDRSVAMKWKVIPKLEGYKVVKVSYEMVDSSGSEVGKKEVIPGSKQELPELALVLVGDDGRNVVDFVLAKDADFVAAVQAEQRKRQAAEGGTASAGAAPGAAGAAPGAPGTPPADAGPKISGDTKDALQKAKSLADAGNHAQ